MQPLRNRPLARAGVLVGAITLAGLGLTTPAAAATVTSEPGLTWGVSKPCTVAQQPANCATIRATTTIGSTLYVAGDFTQLVSRDGTTRAAKNIAALDSTTGTPLPGFTTHTLNGQILSLAASPDGSRLYAGGGFSSYDGTGSAKHIVALSSATGAKIKSFDGQIGGTGSVYALLVTPTRLYAGGKFTQVQSASHTAAVALDLTTGAADPGFAPSITNPPSGNDTAVADVRSLAVGSDAAGRARLYVGGHFDMVGGVPRSTIAALDPASGVLDTTFAPTIDQSYVTADPLQAGLAILAVGGASPGVVLAQAGHTNRAYRFSLTGARVWYYNPDGDVQALAMDGDSVYLGGHFEALRVGKGTTLYPHMHLAAVSYASGGIPDASFSPTVGSIRSPYYYGVWALRMVDGRLWAGGAFGDVTVGGTSYFASKLAVFPHA